MQPKKAYIAKALDTLEAFEKGRINREEAGSILMEIATEPIIEDDDVLDDIFTDLTMIDEPEGKGRLTPKEIIDLKRRLYAILPRDSKAQKLHA